MVDTDMVEGEERSLSLSKLRDMYSDGLEADGEVFKEMRSCVRLYSGRHYRTKREHSSTPFAVSSRFVGAGTPSVSGDSRKRLKLTFNHIPRIAHFYVAEIVNATPDVVVTAKDEGDIRAARLAKLNNIAWESHKKKIGRYDDRLREEAFQFVVTGEVCSKVYWDDQAQWLKEETVMPFDLIRAPGAVSVETSPWLIHSKVYTKRQVEEMFGKRIARLTVHEGGAVSGTSSSGAYARESIVFDSRDREYHTMEGVEIREFYMRPCRDYPRGYFVYFTDELLLERGELPGGLFPFVVGRCFIDPTLARGHSFIRTVYHTQHEINRAASQDATNMAHFGTDLIVTDPNSNINVGKQYFGANHLQVSSFTNDVRTSFQHIEGHGLPKYVDYVGRKIMEMDNMVNLQTQMQTSQGKKGDIYYVLYSKIKDQQKFETISSSFANFLKEKGELVLSHLRFYLHSEEIVHAGNREDLILVGDFKNTDDRDYSFSVQEGKETAEERLGKSLVGQQILQYVGDKLDRNDIGVLLSHTMTGNVKDLVSEFTIDRESSIQDIISLEKGLWPRTSKVQSFEYKAKKIALRMSKPDFGFLPPAIQDLFRQFLEFCEKRVVEQKNEKLRLESGMIPTSGAMIGCDLQMMVPGSRGQMVPKRVRFPSHALEWLKKTLETQGMVMEGLETMNPQSQASIAGGLQGPAAQVEAAGAGGMPAGGAGAPPMPAGGLLGSV